MTIFHVPVRKYQGATLVWGEPREAIINKRNVNHVEVAKFYLDPDNIQSSDYVDCLWVYMAKAGIVTIMGPLSEFEEWLNE